MPMIITRPTSIEVIEKITPFVTMSDPKLVELYLMDLASVMMHNPMSLLFLTWFEEDEIRGFLTARDLGPQYPYAAVTQFWGHTLNPRDWIEPFFKLTILWAVAHDKKYLRAETQRDLGAFYRRFGFEPYLQVVKFDLADSTKELLNG